MQKNLINYENYEAHKQAYGHVATWALWNEDIFGVKEGEIDRDYALRKQLFIADSAAEYEEKNLAALLNGDVVVLALNFSCRKEPKNNKNPIITILNKYKDEAQSRKRYEELLNLRESDDRFSFFNMYVPAGLCYAEGFMNSPLLHGAYMTDFVKFVEDNGESLSAGIPESKSTAEIVRKYMSKDTVDLQAQGFKHELDLLGIKPKVIVNIASQLNSNLVKGAITRALGYRPHFEQLYHYSPLASMQYKRRGYESRDAMYLDQIKQLEANIAAKL